MSVESELPRYSEEQTIGRAHDDIIGQPVLLTSEIDSGNVAYSIGLVVHKDGHVTVEYLSPED